MRRHATAAERLPQDHLAEARPREGEFSPPRIRLSSLTQSSQRRRFCWDLDSLVTPPCVFGDYRTVKPIRRNIELVRQLHAAGHCIIISTSRGMQQRGMLSHLSLLCITDESIGAADGNVNAAVADNAAVTLATLAKLQIPYDECVAFKSPSFCLGFTEVHLAGYSSENPTLTATSILARSTRCSTRRKRSAGMLRAEHQGGAERAALGVCSYRGPSSVSVFHRLRRNLTFHRPQRRAGY